jgi:hypothetical protein
MIEIPSEYRGWWRIVDTSQWVNDGLDILGPALLSLTGYADRLRMHCLLADVNCKCFRSSEMLRPDRASRNSGVLRSRYRAGFLRRFGWSPG